MLLGLGRMSEALVCTLGDVVDDLTAERHLAVSCLTIFELVKNMFPAAGTRSTSGWRGITLITSTAHTHSFSLSARATESVDPVAAAPQWRTLAPDSDVRLSRPMV